MNKMMNNFPWTTPVWTLMLFSNQKSRPIQRINVMPTLARFNSGLDKAVLKYQVQTRQYEAVPTFD